MFLEKYIFIVIEKKMSYFNDNIETCSDDSYNEDSNEKYFNESDDSDED